MDAANEFERNAIAVNTAERLAGPARALTGFYELLADEASLSEMAQDLDRIGAATKQLNALVDLLMQGNTSEFDSAGELSAARIRHDLRTPLNAIIGYLELILEEDIDAERNAVAQDLRAMLSAAGELLSHVDAIADLSRPADRPDGFRTHWASTRCACKSL